MGNWNDKYLGESAEENKRLRAINAELVAVLEEIEELRPGSAMRYVFLGSVLVLCFIALTFYAAYVATIHSHGGL